MSKKLTKTIILIVFVVFSGINKVEARICRYQNDKASVSIKIDDDGTLKNVTGTGKMGSKNYDIDKLGSHPNWEKWGAVYFEKSKSCPPNIMIKQTKTKEEIYFYDASSPSANDENTKLIEEEYSTKRSSYLYLVGSDDPAQQSASESSLKFYKSIKCSCSGTSSGGTSNIYRFSANLYIDAGLNSPTVNVTSNLFTSGSYNRTIENWKSRPKWFSSENNYVFALSYNNTCPAYLIIAHRAGAVKLFVSDSATKNQMISDVQEEYGSRDIYAVSCKMAEDKNDTSNENVSSNSNSNSNNEGNNNDSNITSDNNSADSTTSEQTTRPPEISANVGSLNTDLKTYSCGEGFLTDIPANLINLTHIFYNFLQFIVPLAIIILGTLDLLKAIASQKEDEIKKGQSIFFKRLIESFMVFFVLAIIKLLVGVVSANSESVIECLDCFLKGESKGADSASCREES